MNARTRDGSPQPEASVQLIKIRTLSRQLLCLGFAATPAGFSPDGQSLLFTSIREAGGQADTYRYDFASGSIT